MTISEQTVVILVSDSPTNVRLKNVSQSRIRVGNSLTIVNDLTNPEAKVLEAIDNPLQSEFMYAAFVGTLYARSESGDAQLAVEFWPTLPAAPKPVPVVQTPAPPTITPTWLRGLELKNPTAKEKSLLDSVAQFYETL